jgi:hypothetical protein
MMNGEAAESAWLRELWEVTEKRVPAATRNCPPPATGDCPVTESSPQKAVAGCARGTPPPDPYNDASMVVKGLFVRSFLVQRG